MEIEEYGVICEGKETTLRASRQGLPPTPPSSASSDSEGTASASCSPERRDSQTSTQNLRGLLAPRLYVTNGTHTTRQPIHTPLISCQPVRPSKRVWHRWLSELLNPLSWCEFSTVINKLQIIKKEKRKSRRKIFYSIYFYICYW